MSTLNLPETGRPIVVGSMTAPSVRCFAAMLAARTVYVDPQQRHLPLRHSHHRYAILGPNGVQQLSIPLVGSTNAMPVPMQGVRISEHARWRHLHWGAIFSAYGSTPYFPYIADNLQQLILDDSDPSLFHFNQRLTQLIIEFLDLPITIETLPSGSLMEECCDLRNRLGTKRPDGLPIMDVPYHQLWADRHGFQPNLSILDLLMNCGRESIFTLIGMAQSLDLSSL
ncbi:MAG: WbqC family protein [Muribaculaceae bacterium]|nr:WbqC family protein [Muribaculaceae bacterium]